MPSIEHFREYIERALEHAGGSHTFADVEQAVAEGRLQFWPGPHSVVLTEIIEYPQGLVLNYFIAGGGGPNPLAELEAMVPQIEAWGRERGCKRATFIGRKGWGRTFLTRTGWRPTLEVFEKGL